MGITQGRRPKDPEKRARTNAAAGWVRVLPAHDYDGPIPEWPLKPARTKVERDADAAMWEYVWRSPQGWAWIEMGPIVVLELARYVKLHRSESDKAPAEIRQIGDRFGMSPLSMARLRWTIAESDAEVEAAPLASVSTLNLVAD